MKIEYRDVKQLKAYKRNARKHSAEQIQLIANSIKEVTWTKPIVIDDHDMILAGHGALEAATTILKLKRVPVVVMRGLTQKQKRTYIVADNAIPARAEWDLDLLSTELLDLKKMGVNLTLTGLETPTIDRLLSMGSTNGRDPDAVPPTPATAITQPGDVWILGNHRICCGDAEKRETWEKAEIPKGAVLITSPRYNLGRSASLSGNRVSSARKRAYANNADAETEETYQHHLQRLLELGLIHCEAAAINVQPLAESKRPLLRWMAANATSLVDTITWDKGHAAPAMAQGVTASRYEWIVIFTRTARGGVASRRIPFSSWRGTISNVYQGPPQRTNDFPEVNAATFPVHLPQWILHDLMDQATVVVDCCAGTGTTIIAAQMEGRRAISIDIDPLQCDITVQRWQDFTGMAATNEKTGKTYPKTPSRKA